ncbi:hypothetical protein KFE25_003786 [Diacronema lutheri]|uniref:Uncharacterized protein n=1 Tax=Diacronema lutheri TaxID=2081491 RepID=A0A8J5X762_DIALT|nr:hypothetical protein KFE25_003786 [Diacronema lutheri]
MALAALALVFGNRSAELAWAPAEGAPSLCLGSALLFVPCADSSARWRLEPPAPRARGDGDRLVLDVPDDARARCLVRRGARGLALAPCDSEAAAGGAWVHLPLGALVLAADRGACVGRAARGGGVELTPCARVGSSAVRLGAPRRRVPGALDAVLHALMSRCAHAAGAYESARSAAAAAAAGALCCALLCAALARLRRHAFLAQPYAYRRLGTIPAPRSAAQLDATARAAAAAAAACGREPRPRARAAARRAEPAPPAHEALPPSPPRAAKGLPALPAL